MKKPALLLGSTWFTPRERDKPLITRAASIHPYTCTKTQSVQGEQVSFLGQGSMWPRTVHSAYSHATLKMFPTWTVKVCPLQSLGPAGSVSGWFVQSGYWWWPLGSPSVGSSGSWSPPQSGADLCLLYPLPGHSNNQMLVIMWLYNNNAYFDMFERVHISFVEQTMWSQVAITV